MKKHAQQVAAWGKLSGLCNTLGDAYKPSKDSMKGTALENLLHASENQVEAVHNAETVLATAISDRHRAFDKLPFLGTRIVSAVKAQDAEPEYVANVNRIRKKFRGPTPSKKATALKTSPGEQAGQTVSTSTSSTPVLHKKAEGDMNSKIDNLHLLIAQLENGPPYETSEDDLSIESLKKYYAELKQKHEAVAQAQQVLKQERQKRDAMLYGTDGMHHLAAMVKRYVQSVYGFGSVQFKSIRQIKFSK